jgi:hypothetical protein
LFGENTAHGSNWYLGGGAIWGSSVDNFDISYCCFYNNVATGLYGGSIHESPQWGDSDFSLDHCTFWGASSAIEVFGAGYSTRLATLDVTNCIFTHCDVAIGNLSNITLTVEYSDFYNNQVDINNPPAGFGVLDRVNYNGDSCDCYYDIFMDPMFVDTTNFNFHLLAGSPCIDAGNPTFPYDPDSTITDMGAYWYDQTGIREYDVVKNTNKCDFLSATVFSGPLLLPEGKKCKVIDIMGRVVVPDKIKPGIYFIEVDGAIVNKVIKIK